MSGSPGGPVGGSRRGGPRVAGYRRSRAVAVAASLAVVAGALAGGAAVASPAAAHARAYAAVGRAPRVPAGARMIGATDPGRVISAAIALKPRHPQALAAAAAAVSSPRSPSFHHFLAKGDFAAAYGASPETIKAVSAALTASHLTVTNVARDNLLVRFRGTVGAAERAFRTRVADYRLRSGRIGRETTSAASLPASIAGQVEAVVGLDTLLTPTAALRHGTHPASQQASGPTHPLANVTAGPHACGAATDVAKQLGGLTDEQIANAYGVTNLYQAGDVASGQHIGVFELEPFSTADLTAFDRCFFPSQYTAMLGRTHVVTVDGGPGTGPGSGESILDIEDVEGIAPGASVDVYEAPNTSVGSLDEYAQMINDDQDSVISTSWGVCELDESQLEPGYINIENELFEQAALQGQTVFSSSGDSGADTCSNQSPTPVQPDLSVGDPSSQPFVVSVGGTTMSNAGVPPTERVWDDGSVAGSTGGGVSGVWGAPSWLVAVDSADRSAVTQAVNDGLTQCAEAASGGLCRQLPDVSAAADEYTGSITLYASSFGGWSTIGGTSSATPLWAAMTAEINASSQCAGSTQPHGGVGFLSPSLYAIAAVPSEYSASFNDVTAGNNDQYDVNGGRDYAAAKGYDMASGLGTPILAHPGGRAGLANYLCTLGAASVRPAITSVSPDVIPVHPTTPNLVITGTGFSGVTAVSVGGYDVPRSHITVTNAGKEIDVSPVPTGPEVGTGSAGPQDGSGRHLVMVTGSNGMTSIPTASTSVLYVDTNGGTIPSVSGTSPFGGPIDAPSMSVTVYGSGFNSDGGVTGVTVGGVSAPSFTVRSDTQMSVTIPPYVPALTVCAPGDDPANDVCQAQVVVGNANGDSEVASILPPLTGTPFVGQFGGPPPQCVRNSTCEATPATTEYDYLVRPHIDTFSPDFVSENPGNASTGTITGRGFDSLGFAWVDIGSPSDPNSADINLVSITPTKVQFTVSGHSATRLPATRKLFVQTIQGLSNQSRVTYAGIPKVTDVSPNAGPDSGGTPVTISGQGFFGVDAADGGAIVYVYPDFGLGSSQLSGYAASSAGTSISETTPANNPGQFVVEVCTVTACSSPPLKQSAFKAILFDFFDPGDPVVKSMSAHTGPAGGGTHVRIHGSNLSDVTSVTFGGRKANATNPVQLLTNGSNTEIDAIAPPGRPGTTVDVIVRTAESDHGGHASAKTRADRFHYVRSRPSPPRTITVVRHGTSPTVHWSAPLSNGGFKILRYRVTAHALKNSDKKGAKSPKNTVVVASGRARKATLRGLRAGWFYGFKVQAINQKGAGRAGRNGKIYLISQPAR